MDDVIPADIRREIESRLADIEREHDVVVFHACESGSRAWDFASGDSDFDVRFLYMHPPYRYLALWEQRDVIETPTNGIYDVNGWDLRKALRLAAKGNPVLFEWLCSPIRYLERPLAARFREAVFNVFDPTKAYHHYLSMARSQVRTHLSGKTVRHKKYFYAVRPLLACQFLLDRRTMIPMRFAELLEAVAVPDDVTQALAKLLAAKRRASEAAAAERIPALDRWIDATATRLENAEPPPGCRHDFLPLEAFFREAIAV